MKLSFSILVIILSSNAFSQHNLTVRIEGIEEVKGEIEFCLFDNDEDFMYKAVRCTYVPVNSKSTSYQFTNITAKDYAVVIYHDLNDNRDLDTGWMNIPTEPYGFSNNPSTRFGPPNFKKASFTVDGDKEISISLN